MLLAIDASTSWASLAIMDGQHVLSHLDWNVGRQHSVEIFPQLEALLQAAGITSLPINEIAPSPPAEGVGGWGHQISAIAVATGPGSFNGTRVAVTVAKTLAFVWQVPLVGCSTLTGIAQAAVISAEIGMPLAEQGGTVLAVLEAGRDELYTCWYDLHIPSIINRAEDGADHAPVVHPKGEIAIASVADVAASALQGPVLLCGEISEAHQAGLQAALGTRLQVLLQPSDPHHTRAVGLGRQAQLRLAAGDLDDALTLEPTYVRRPNITTSKRHPMPPSHE